MSLPTECPAGVWGTQCDRECGECEGGAEFCQVYDGRCFNGCSPGYHGELCNEACPDRTHGQYCKHKCGHCSDLEPICDKVTGECYGGCMPGYQKPFCKLPCPYKTWGPKCSEVCDCPEKTSCGCDPITGDCRGCDKEGNPIYFARKVPKTALDIPWIPILSFVGLIGFFVFTNFIYWLWFVRTPSKGDKEVRVYRDKKPKKLRIQDWKIAFDDLHLTDRRMRLRLKMRRDRDAKKARAKSYEPGDIIKNANAKNNE